MVTLKTRTELEINNVYENEPLEFMGLSTDAKPTKAFDIIQRKEIDIPNGSTFFEMDTKTAKFFSQATSEWI